MSEEIPKGDDWDTSGVCEKCGQKDEGQFGEYPCSECGLPLLWGDPDD